MKVIEVARDQLPEDWTEEHVQVLKNGHERGVVADSAESRIGYKVLGFASNHGVGVTVFGGLTFVDVSPGGPHGEAVRFEVTD